MENNHTPISTLLDSIKARAKEFNCLFRVEELLKDYDQDIRTVLADIIETIPEGMQYSTFCHVRIVLHDEVFQSPEYVKSEWILSAYLAVQNIEVGSIEISYAKKFPDEDDGPFLEEEKRLIITIANRIGDFIQHQELQHLLNDIKQVKSKRKTDANREWRIAIDLTKRTDGELYIKITRKMIVYLSWKGIAEAVDILQKIGSVRSSIVEALKDGDNIPHTRNKDISILPFAEQVYDIANENLSDEEIFSCIRKWMHEDRTSFLLKTLIHLNSTLGDIDDILRRFQFLSSDGITISDYTLKGVRVALIRKIISDSLKYINIIKNYVEIDDFIDLLKRMIYPTGSQGQLGGKSAGLFLATQIIKGHRNDFPELKDIKTPNTWYITSDGLHNFMDHNDLEDVTEQKYKDLKQVRQEYPHIIQLFKSSQFTPEIIRGLSVALDDFGDKPIIVRSSSLLEDSIGAAFSGKYKSLFLANQGNKEDRLAALMDAVAEVYSSTFGYDPIEYRTERGLIDFKEEMGIIIQEVVGSKIGKYYLPAFAGVAFSKNEFRWSPRIKREDGLIRLVPGLGTRAVDRLSEDFPILVSPGQPELRVNVTPDEIIKYSPKYIDAINLETNSFETIEIKKMLQEHGDEYPGLMKLISVYKDGRMIQPSIMDIDYANDDIIVTFEGLISKSPFMKQMKTILDLLQEKADTSIDLEFASDGKNIFLLQCRPQGTGLESAPATIPKKIAKKNIIFTTTKYISNGFVPNITHIVYVDSQKYSELSEVANLLRVGRAVGRLNEVLPRHHFILLGPGRWGSRGDIKLGVNVTYSDINNTAALIEIARKKGNYIPDLSFGTHFFQDLTEAQIRYIPLYPDEDTNVFNEDYLLNSHNSLANLAPDFSDMSDVIKVINVPEVSDGKILEIYMNAGHNIAMAAIIEPRKIKESFE